MPKVISPNQCSFVPGRHGSDNIIVTQEVIHSCGIKKGKRVTLQLKLTWRKHMIELDGILFKMS